MAAPAPRPPRKATSTAVSDCREFPRHCPSARAQATSWTRPAQPDSAKTIASGRSVGAERVSTRRDPRIGSSAPAAPGRWPHQEKTQESPLGPAAGVLGQQERELLTLALDRGEKARRERVLGAEQGIGAQHVHAAVALRLAQAGDRFIGRIGQLDLADLAELDLGPVLEAKTAALLAPVFDVDAAAACGL